MSVWGLLPHHHRHLSHGMGWGRHYFPLTCSLPPIYSPALSVFRRLTLMALSSRQTPCPLAWANAEGPDERLGGLLPASLLAELESEPSQMNAGFAKSSGSYCPALGGHTWPPGAFQFPRSVPGPSRLTSTCVCSLDKGVTTLRRIFLLFSR